MRTNQRDDWRDCRLIVTVPRGLLENSGFEDVHVRRAGFPFFNLYKTTVIMRGKRLIDDVEHPKDGLNSGASDATLRFFERAFRYNLKSSPFGWQLLAVAKMPGQNELESS